METIYNLHDPDLEPRLRNWANWCKPSLILWPIACNGLESNYKSNQVWEATPSPRIAIDILDAHKLEDAIVKLPKRYKTALKHWYITKLDTRWIAKRAGTKDVGQLMRDSWAELKKCLH